MGAQLKRITRRSPAWKHHSGLTEAAVAKRKEAKKFTPSLPPSLPLCCAASHSPTGTPGFKDIVTSAMIGVLKTPNRADAEPETKKLMVGLDRFVKAEMLLEIFKTDELPDL